MKSIVVKHVFHKLAFALGTSKPSILIRQVFVLVFPRELIRKCVLPVLFCVLDKAASQSSKKLLRTHAVNCGTQHTKAYMVTDAKLPSKCKADYDFWDVKVKVDL